MEFKEAIKAYAKMMGVSESEAKQDAEATIKMWMTTEGMTREFAEASWIEEQEDADPELLKQMEKQAKETGATKVKAKRAPNYSLEGQKKRERKPNEEKRALIAAIASCLEDFHRNDEEDLVSHVDLVEIANVEREITFKIGENAYSLTLTLHRKPKK
jgi:hypothetical protein